MADPASVRVRRADGALFNFSKKDADAFIAANPGSKISERPAKSAAGDSWRPSAQATAAETANPASADEPPAIAGITRMRKDELEALAAEKNVDISGAKNNEERAQLILAAAAGAQDADADNAPEDDIDLEVASRDELEEFAIAHDIEFDNTADADGIVAAIEKWREDRDAADEDEDNE